MGTWAPALRAVLPIVALGLLAFVWGNFAGAAGAAGATASQAILVGILAAGVAGWRRLGRGEAAALSLLWLAVGLSVSLSEVPRAGRCAVVLVPACCILPRLVAVLFPAAAALRAAARGLALLLALAAGYGLWGTLWGGTPGASLPLGHHNLLAAFLLMLLPAPLALLAGRGPHPPAPLSADGKGGEPGAAPVGELAAPRWLPVSESATSANDFPTVAPAEAGAQSPVCNSGMGWRLGPGLRRDDERGRAALPTELGRSKRGAVSDRWLATGATGLGVAALLATRSLGGAIGLGVLVLLLLPWRRLGRWPLALGGVAVFGLVLVALLPRLLHVGEDVGASAAARAGYYEAGWRGFLAAPWLGQGPGSTPWLFARYFAPRVAVHPPDHIVGDLHSLPLQVLFELGIVGALAAAGWLFVLLRPLFAARAPDDPFRAALLRGSRAGLVAALVFSGTGVLLSVPVLPISFGLLAGLGLAAIAAPGESVADRRGSWPVAIVVAAVATVWLLPGLRAQWQWDRARRDPGVALAALEKAVALDPLFPLYRSRLAGLAREAEEAARAERDAVAVGPLTLQAGLAAEAAGGPEAGELLARACDLDPFGGLAPLRLAVGAAGGDDQLRVERAMRALVAEPRLVAAAAWRERPEILRSALRRLEQENEPAGWAAELAPGAERVLEPIIGATADLVLAVDADPAEAVSLVLFRRSPWKAPLARVPIVTDALPDLPPAVLDPTMRADFAAPSCRWRPAPAPEP